MTSSLPTRACERPERSCEQEERRYHGLILLLACSILGAATVLQHSHGSSVRLPFSRIALPELCTLHRLFDIPCPGCGLTRGTMALVRGDVEAAVHYNPVSPLIFGMVVGQIPYRLFTLWQIQHGKSPWVFPGGWAWWGVAFGAMLIQWIVRIVSGG